MRNSHHIEAPGRRRGLILCLGVAALFLSGCNSGKPVEFPGADTPQEVNQPVSGSNGAGDPLPGGVARGDTPRETPPQGASGSDGRDKDKGGDVPVPGIHQPGTDNQAPVADADGPVSPPRGKEEKSAAEPRKLTWQPPLTREDGTSLYPGEIEGYRIYFKKAHERQFQALSLENPDDTVLPLEGFSPGVYEFSISTVDINGLESRRSSVVQVYVTG